MGKGSLSSKQDRLDRLLGLLRSEDFWTTEKLCVELNASHRTLQRDLKELKEAGYPIDSERGRGGGIRLDGRWGLGRLQLSNKEVITLLTSLTLSENLGPSFITSGSKKLRQKIAQLFPESQRKAINLLRERILVGQQASSNVLKTYKQPLPEILSKISNSFFDFKKLHIEYQSEKNEQTSRLVEPHYLLLNWPVWYALCWDELRGDVRAFRADRIMKATLSSESIKKRKPAIFLKNIEEYFDKV